MKTATHPQTRTITDTVAEYFAYVAGVSFAVALALIAIVYTGSAALTWIDVASKPAAKHITATAADKPDAVFAMLPLGLPKNVTTSSSGKL